MSQLNLLGEDEEKSSLGSRQQLVLEALREQHGLTDDEAGALVHASRGKHGAEERCAWCAKEGKGVLASLRRRGYCTRRRTGVWEPKGVRAAQSAADGHDPSTAPIPY